MKVCMKNDLSCRVDGSLTTVIGGRWERLAKQNRFSLIDAYVDVDL